MGLGSVVKYYRLKAGMTQNELCREICSVSHLSKIENDSYEGNEETIALLFKRLGLSFKDEEKKAQQMGKEIESLINALRYHDEDLIEKQYEYLISNKDYCLSSKFLFKYQIAIMWYHNYQNNLAKAQEIKEILEKLFKNMDRQEQCLFIITSAQTIRRGNEPKKAIKFLKDNAEYIYSKYEHDYFYLLGLFYSTVNDAEKSLIYTKKCIIPFQDELNLVKLISCHILLAICYVKIGMLEEASITYNHVLRNLKMLNKTQMYYQNLYNYALLFIEKGEYSEALKMCKECISYFDEKNEEYVIIKLTIINIYILIDEDKDLVRKEIEHLIKLTQNSPLDMYKLYAERYEKELSLPSLQYHNFLEKKFLPFLYNNNDFEEARTIELKMADYYSCKEPLKSIDFYKNILKRGAN